MLLIFASQGASKDESYRVHHTVLQSLLLKYRRANSFWSQAMTKRIELNESLNLRGSIFAGIAGSSEGPSIDGMLRIMESQIDLGLGFVKGFLVEGLLTLGAAMGMGMVALLVGAGWQP